MHEHINGDQALVAIERAIHELRCGRALYCRDTHIDSLLQRGILIASAETTSAAVLARLEARAGNAGLSLVITRQRALALDMVSADMQSARGAVRLQLRRPVTIETVLLVAGALAHSSQVAPLMQGNFDIQACDALDTLALTLAKQARLLPALLVVATEPPATDQGIFEISATQLERLALPGTFDLQPVSDARVPLGEHEDCRLIVFRDGRDASEHIAIIIGSPDTSAVPVRLHSACFTGDLLGSLRCDCGDQLRGAVDQIAAAGGGVLLYLAQEGRGTGLANKLRAYELQDKGLDTIDADLHLGFEPDERNYVAAASMLKHLGMTHIHLLTNNLEKIQALQKSGIEVVTGQRLLGNVNRHNLRYISAKRDRAGHLMPEIKVEGFL